MNATEFYKKWDSNIEKSSTQKMNMFADDMDDLLDDAPVDSDFNELPSCKKLHCMTAMHNILHLQESE